MIDGALWRRWVFFYVPLDRFCGRAAVPVLLDGRSPRIRPDRELYRPWNAPNYAPFWTWHPTLEHITDLLTQTFFYDWLLNTMIIALLATAISLFCGLLAGYALSRFKFPVRRRARYRHLHHVSRAANPVVHSARRYDPQFSPWRLALGADPDLPDVSDPVLHLADDGLFQVHSQRNSRNAPGSTARRAGRR